MTKRPREASAAGAPDSTHGNGDNDGRDGSAVKKPRTFMATLVRSNGPAVELHPHMRNRKDQSMTVAINAIRRLEAKVEDLTTALNSSRLPPSTPDQHLAQDHRSPFTVNSHASPGMSYSFPQHRSPLGVVGSLYTTSTSGRAPQTVPEAPRAVQLSFSQHGVTLWPAIAEMLPADFIAARKALPRNYVVDIESHRHPLPIHIDLPAEYSGTYWLTRLPLSVIKGLAEAYFAVFHRNTPVLDKFQFFSSTLNAAIDSDFGYDVETCLVLIVLALGCLAVRAYEEGDFALPSRMPSNVNGFVRPDWYELIIDDPSGLKFFNEARQRLGFITSQNDLQSGQFYMLCTLYYAQILRPIDSWTTVNRAALCCISMLSRAESIDFDDWEGDMLSRLFWNTLMYETIITQELGLPRSGLLDHEADIPIPKFTACPRPKTSISRPLVDEDDSFFNFHFLAQAAHRIILTRIRRNLYSFAEKEAHPSPTLTTEMHHQLEQWRSNLPPSLQFTDNEDADIYSSPAHVIAKAMLRSRFRVAKFHIGRPFLYKALHAPEFTTQSEYDEVRKGLEGAMYWPTTMGLCAQMKAALPIKFGWCSQCFGQILLFNAVARSPNPNLRATLPEGWENWVGIMMELIESCARESPGITKDYELLQLLR
ncbi:C6 zinc finger domain-containing protein [Bimuria novae-zelandiae CBS 107.79]|uniref:C6 zinc finger domain-containing protein n=1 Tax=Bimuria novae-zelandiae CBS 107.79 TaxID=1447943 RepID=A0A6A5VS60_9PLEO|nr:C6 zinc finger domain-containing protein [Bimuria novae-zelandiae CBS 107.79]